MRARVLAALLIISPSAFAQDAERRRRFDYDPSAPLDVTEAGAESP